MEWYQIVAICMICVAVGMLLGHAVGYGKGVRAGSALTTKRILEEVKKEIK